MLQLPSTFSFSQSSLQAYENCARRFWLSYVERLPWPAVEAQPLDDFERHIRQGARFHRLVERAETGIEPRLLAMGLEDPLDDWFDAYLRHRPSDLPEEHKEVERVLSVPIELDRGRYRLAARYDLISAGGADGDKRVVIVDWKTNLRPVRREFLQQRLQTLVYPFVLVEASASLPWGPVEPEAVEMRYWFTAAPGDPVVFRYSAALHASARSRIYTLIDSILGGEKEADFPKVPDTEENRRRYCGFCVYRSRCERGVDAMPMSALDEAELYLTDLEEGIEISLEEVEELAF